MARLMRFAHPAAAMGLVLFAMHASRADALAFGGSESVRGRPGLALRRDESMMGEATACGAMRLKGGAAPSATWNKQDMRSKVGSAVGAAATYGVKAAKVTGAALGAMLTTSAVMMGTEYAAHCLDPTSDPAAPTSLLAALVLAGGVLGSMAGALTLARLAPLHTVWIALLVSSLFTSAQYVNLTAVPHPKWFAVLAMLAFIPPYTATAHLATHPSPRDALRAPLAWLPRLPAKPLQYSKPLPRGSPARPNTPARSVSPGFRPSTPRAQQTTGAQTPPRSHKKKLFADDAAAKPASSTKTPSKPSQKDTEEDEQMGEGKERSSSPPATPVRTPGKSKKLLGTKTPPKTPSRGLSKSPRRVRAPV